jgi:hypothetical protein
MTQIRTLILPLATLVFVAAAPAFAQNQAPSQSSTKMEDVSKWTQKQWNAAKAKWSKEKVKWAHCQSKEYEKMFSGRKSWPFLYDCMTK